MLQRVTTEVNAYIWTPLWRGVCVWGGRRRGGGGGLRQKWDVIRRRGWVKGVSRVLDVQSLFFLLKKNGFAPWADIMLLTRNLSFDSGVRQWSFPLMIPLHCFWAKSNNRKRDKCERDVLSFVFCFVFVRSHARCGCCSIVCLRFQVIQIKKFDCKMSTKDVNNRK